MGLYISAMDTSFFSSFRAFEQKKEDASTDHKDSKCLVLHSECGVVSFSATELKI